MHGKVHRRSLIKVLRRNWLITHEPTETQSSSIARDTDTQQHRLNESFSQLLRLLRFAMQAGRAETIKR